MGIFSQISNKKQSDRQKHAMKWKRRVRAVKKASKPGAPLIIPDADLLSTDMLKNKLKNPRNNITLSNKKRKRILKRLKHRQVASTSREEEEDDDEEEKDCEMKETAESCVGQSESEPTTTANAESCDPSCSGSCTMPKTKKKRGPRKKGGNSRTQANTDDVEMKDDA